MPLDGKKKRLRLLFIGNAFNMARHIKIRISQGRFGAPLKVDKFDSLYLLLKLIVFYFILRDTLIHYIDSSYLFLKRN